MYSFNKDTLRAIKDVYLTKSSVVDLIDLMNNSEIACRLINCMRNTFRFISIYVLIAFSLHRLYVTLKPSSKKFKYVYFKIIFIFLYLRCFNLYYQSLSKNSGYKIIFTIVVASFLVNSWIPFL